MLRKRLRQLGSARQQSVGHLVSRLGGPISRHDAVSISSEAVDCLSETTASLFLDRRLPHEDAVAVELHMDRCASCRKLLSALVKDPSRPRAAGDAGDADALVEAPTVPAHG